jgi:hypothetical protein
MHASYDLKELNISLIFFPAAKHIALHVVRQRDSRMTMTGAPCS